MSFQPHFTNHPAFEIAGITQIISNEKGQAAQAINALWTRFYNDSIVDLIPHKQGAEVYAAYSDYQGDHTQPYRMTIGCAVQPESEIAAPLHHVRIPAAKYAMFAATGEQPQALINTWNEIWTSDLPRSMKHDFEIYGPRFFAPGLHEILVYIGMNNVEN